MSLYKVSFTTKKEVTRYNDKREIESVTVMEVPVTIGGLPLATAQTYAKCDNFVMEKQFASMDEKVGFRARQPRSDDGVKFSARKPAVNKQPRRDKVQEAAATGDMAEAINRAA